MKIIKETDPRYEYLPQIFKEYNYWNIIIYPEGGRPMYVIPKLLALDDIWRSDWIHCSKSEDGIVYSGPYLPKWMKIMTGLTTQEYFDLSALHINDTEERPICDGCHGEKLPWSGSIRCGYGSHGHLWEESDKHFCCRSCAAWLQWHDENGYSDTMREFKATGGTFGNMNDDTFCYMLIDSRRTDFINRGNPDDPCKFYITWTTSGNAKFGVSTDLGYRYSYSRFVDKFKCMHVLASGTRLKLADLEANIKRELHRHYEYLTPERLPLFWKLFRKYN